ncbi:uncharacterized protein HMPREF1541_04270 [Cyphellophora europaea CBS 101466]|uniref:Zn(2)-C6 fungal-type domain-containing protein n=1 Tax=Cyphellophora europaea (strain CBS 101466) TaxID=1220924 RepID=W2RUL4_CYPE1|nr:uncharacterized protein HMPREF1541_04270 [Cyphellophora europaea CBS 101466]ETN39995.1 hypothetical protein HMPREF1541_04270 [Cyphellophora europaea CBS 101466]
MTDISNFTGKFRLNGPEAGKVTKRPRASLTCSQCRKQKLKCDRGQPCNSCIKRGDTARCSYGQHPTPEASADRQHLAEQKLAHLETMVLQLMQKAPDHEQTLPRAPSQTLTPPEPNNEVPEQRPGGYTGSTHWSAMLNDIQELKTAIGFEIASNAFDNPDETDAPPEEVIYGCSATYSLKRIVKDQLPAREDVERLLSIHFAGETFVLPIIHASHFRRQCQQFWSAPFDAEPLWLSILFSTCFMAAKIAVSTGMSGSLAFEPSSLQTAAGQCLVLGQYNRPQRYAPEALLLYAQTKSFYGLDPPREAGAVLGLTVRHAYSMGYHRDPDTVGTFSPFESEMRRRFWATCKQMDLMLSFQLGLPSHIRLENCDTKSPRNLLDSDFDEDTTNLPQSRPETKATRFLWFIIKDRQMVTFSKVCQDALSFNERSSTYVHELDAEVRHTYDSIPHVLRSRPISESTADSPFLIMTRIYLEFIYLKSLCVLHRRYMAAGRSYSLTAGSKAARALIARFLEAYSETNVGGQLQANRWMLNSFTVNDFLMGVSTACLAVYQLRQQPEGQSPADSPSEEELLHLLRKALTACTELTNASKDARRVAHAIRLVLGGLGSRPSPEIHKDGDGRSLLPPECLPVAEDAGDLPYQDASVMFGRLDPFDFLGNPMQDFDWSMLDMDVLE